MSVLTLALTLNPIANGASRLSWGWVSDHFGRERTMAVAFLLQSVSLVSVLTLGARSSAWFIVCLVMVYFTWGEIYSLFPATCADYFGSSQRQLQLQLPLQLEGHCLHRRRMDSRSPLRENRYLEHSLLRKRHLRSHLRRDRVPVAQNALASEVGANSPVTRRTNRRGQHRSRHHPRNLKNEM